MSQVMYILVVLFFLLVYDAKTLKCEKHLHFQSDTGKCCLPVQIPKEHEDVPCTIDGKQDTFRPCPYGQTQPNDNISSELRRRCRPKRCLTPYTKLVTVIVNGKQQKKCVCEMELGFCGTEDTHSITSNYMHCSIIRQLMPNCSTGIQQDCSCALRTLLPHTVTRVVTFDGSSTLNKNAASEMPTQFPGSQGIEGSSILLYIWIVVSITVVAIVIAIPCYLWYRRERRHRANERDQIVYRHVDTASSRQDTQTGARVTNNNEDKEETCFTTALQGAPTSQLDGHTVDDNIEDVEQTFLKTRSQGATEQGGNNSDEERAVIKPTGVAARFTSNLTEPRMEELK